MHSTFLGKPVPDLKPVPRPVHKQTHGATLILSLVLPIVAAVLFLFLFMTTPTRAAAASGSTGGAASGPTVFDPGTGGGGTTSTGPTGSVTPTANDNNNGQCAQTLRNLDASVVFPIIPPELQQDGACPSPFWNLDVGRYFAYKGLTALNWLAGAAAILLTVYAGLMYMTGFMGEANVKKAKTVLIATYTGLLITIFARVILYGSIQLTQTGDLDPNRVTLPIPTPTPTPASRR